MGLNNRQENKVEFVIEVRRTKRIRVLASPSEMEEYLSNAKNDFGEVSHLLGLEGEESGDLSAEQLRDSRSIDSEQPTYELRYGAIIRPAPSACPFEEQILDYARSRGVIDPSITYSGIGGWILNGGGQDGFGYPLVWEVAEDCGISWGCGSEGRHQIRPERFKDPREAK